MFALSVDKIDDNNGSKLEAFKNTWKYFLNEISLLISILNSLWNNTLCPMKVVQRLPQHHPLFCAVPEVLTLRQFQVTIQQGYGISVSVCSRTSSRSIANK